MNKLRPGKLWIIYGVVFAAFIGIAVFAGLHHEPWADEAQSWLIARDNDLVGIFKAVRYEGTLPTWHLINKAFQLFGLDYDHIFVIPLVLTAIGVILLFLTDAPLLAKVMLPFSFFVIYQNAVIARQYALVFPAMMLIVLFYKNRLEKPVRYHLALLFLALTSSYGMVISCSFMLWDFIVMLKTMFRDPLYKRFRIPFFATGILVLIIAFLSLPPDDCVPGLVLSSFSKNATTALLFNVESRIGQYLFLAFMLILLAYYFRHDLIRTVVIAAPLVLFMAFFYQREWHMTYLFDLLASLMIIFHDDSKKTTRKPEKGLNTASNIIVIALLATQCLTGAYSIFYDYRNQYSPAKEIAEFIRPYVESGASINRVGFNAVSVSAYYDDPIYSNEPYGKPYYIWSSSVANDKFTEEFPDVVIAHEEIDGFEANYDLHRFDGHMIYKLNELDTEPYFVYVKKQAGT